MFTVTQYLVVACVLPSIIFGAPSLTKRNVFKSLTIDHPSNGVIFPLSVSDRIYGGDVAEPGQFPYQVSLRVKTPIGMYHSCGGSIIASRFVITAGHCYDENREYLVLVGTHSSLFEDGTSYAVQKWFRHEDYLEDLEADNHKLYNDIALIKTKEKIEYNEFVAPIALHPKSFDEGIIAVTLGWGTSDDNIQDLKFTSLTTLSNAECRKRLPNAPVHDWDTICATSNEKANGVCTGDSGGPLVAEYGLIGVTSWAVGCGMGNPDGFTRISTYIDWVDQKLLLHS